MQAGEAGKDKAQEDYDELLASMSVWRSVLHRAEVFLCPTLTACIAVVVLVVALAVVLVVASEDVDPSFVILADAFFESKLLSTVFEAWFSCISRRLLRRTNPYNIFADKKSV